MGSRTRQTLLLRGSNQMETGSKWVNHAWYQYVCFERCLKSEPGWKWVSHACLGIPSGVESRLEKVCVWDILRGGNHHKWGAAWGKSAFGITFWAVQPEAGPFFLVYMPCAPNGAQNRAQQVIRGAQQGPLCPRRRCLCPLSTVKWVGVGACRPWPVLQLGGLF